MYGGWQNNYQYINQPNFQYQPPGMINPYNQFFSNQFINQNGFQYSQQNNVAQMQNYPYPYAQNNQFTYYSNPKNSKKSDKIESEKDKTKEVYEKNTGMYWKINGNEAYKIKNYLLAIKCYSKAIELDGSQSIFYSNRAECYKQLNDFTSSLKDAQESIELDPSNICGNILAGLSLVELGKIEGSSKKIQVAIIRFTKALTLNNKRNIDLERQVIKYIYLSKKIAFYIKQKQRKEEFKNKLQKFKIYVQKDQSLSAEAKEKEIQQFKLLNDKQPKLEIPEFFLCRITLQLMEEPVITNSGQAYERTAIEDHIKKNGLTDPLTRTPIRGPLYPCFTIKKAIEQFLNQNPWAYQFNEGEDYKSIIL